MDKIWLQIVLNIFLFDVNFDKSTIVKGVHGSDRFEFWLHSKLAQSFWVVGWRTRHQPRRTMG